MVLASEKGGFEKDVVETLSAISSSLARIEQAVCQGAPHAIEPNAAYSRQEAARVLGVSVWLIDRARADGRLMDAQRLGQRDVRITGESLVRFQRERESRARVRVNRI